MCLARAGPWRGEESALSLGCQWFCWSPAALRKPSPKGLEGCEGISGSEMLAGAAAPRGDGLRGFWAPRMPWDGRERETFYVMQKEK